MLNHSNFVIVWIETFKVMFDGKLKSKLSSQSIYIILVKINNTWISGDFAIETL